MVDGVKHARDFHDIVIIIEGAGYPYADDVVLTTLHICTKSRKCVDDIVFNPMTLSSARLC